MPISPHPPPDRDESDAGESPWEAALQAGSIEPLLNTGIARLITQVNANLNGEGVSRELATLRIVLARLVAEEQDLDALTRNVARITTVLLQAARLQRQISTQDASSIVDALAVILAEIQPKP